MADIFLKSISIKGYKGFTDNTEINLNVPNGSIGSGLNIFVGENGTGKTSVLEAISLLLVNNFTGQSKVSSSSFNNEENQDIEIIGKIDRPFNYEFPTPWKKTVQIKEIKVEVKGRVRKTPGKLLSSQFQISNILEPTNRNPDWMKDGISDFYLNYESDRMPSDTGINIFFFGKDRIKQSKDGWGTSFSKVMEDFNWRFLSKANQEEILNKWKEFYSTFFKFSGFGEKIKETIIKKFEIGYFQNLSLELIELKEPFSKAFFALTGKNNLSQVPIENLGSGIDLLFSILFLKELGNQSKGSIIYCIDEPELSLHPQWQKIFFKILKEEAKNKQIFISTHSLHFIEPSLLTNLKKFDFTEKINIYSIDKETASNQKLQNLLHLENREMFFTKTIILTEGITEKRRLKLFTSSAELDIFIIEGIGNLDNVKNLCNILNIKFKAIVDLDYVRKFPELLPNLSEEESEQLDEINILNELIELNEENEKVKKILINQKIRIRDNIESCLSGKIFVKMQNEKDYAQKVHVKIDELKSEKIFVLSSGMIEDYLDKHGNASSQEKSKELIKILTD